MTQQNANYNDNVQAPRQAQTGSPVQIQIQPTNPIQLTSPAQYSVQYPNVQNVV